MDYENLQAGRDISFPQYLLSLEDDRLYSAQTVVDNAIANRIFNHEEDAEDKAYYRLKALFQKLGRKDGEIQGQRGLVNAWYGARLKLLLPETALPEPRRQEIVARLEQILTRERNETAILSRLKDLEARMNALDRPRERPFGRLRIGAVGRGLLSNKTVWGSLMLITLALAIWAWHWGPVFTPDREAKNRLVALSCIQSDPVFGNALALALSSSKNLDAFQATELHPGVMAECEDIAEPELIELSDAHRAKFLVWGRAQKVEDGVYEYKGRLYQRGVGARAFRATGRDQFKLASEAAIRILKMLGLDTDILPPRPYYSIDPTANTLFAEGESYMQMGFYSAAAVVLGRASEHFDREFDYGKTAHARALTVVGDFQHAREISETLLTQTDRPLMPKVRLRALKNLAHLYWLHSEIAELESLLLEAKELARELEPESYPMFIKFEAIVALARGRADLAKGLTLHMLEYSSSISDESGKLAAMALNAKIAEDKGNISEAFLAYQDAIDHASKAASISEEINLISEMTGLALKTKANYDLARKRIEDAEGRLLGASLADKIQLNYRKGLLCFAEGKFDAGVFLLEKSYKEALRHGLFFLECLSRIRLAEQFLAEGDLLEVDYLMAPLKTRIDQAPPEYRRRFEQVMWQYHISREAFPEAMGSLRNHLSMAKMTQAPGEVARAMNEIGNVYFKMGDLAEAERQWLEALGFKEKNYPQTAGSTIANLVMLYEKQNRIEEASALKEKIKQME